LTWLPDIGHGNTHELASASSNDVYQLKQFAHFIAAAHCKNLERWNCPACVEPSTVGTTLLHTINEPITGVYGYVAVNPRLRTIVVAYKGTSDTQGWITDDEFLLVPYMEAGMGVLVHGGFLNGLHSVKQQVMEAVGKAVGSYPGFSVSVAGHSLGGAIAALTTQYLARNLPSTSFTLHTYGEPRVGNPAFAAYFDALPNVAAMRFVNGNDLVPTIPPPLIGYRHHAHQFWSPNADENVVKCVGDEDPRCRVLGVLDKKKHTEMLGIRFSGECGDESA